MKVYLSHKDYDKSMKTVEELFSIKGIIENVTIDIMPKRMEYVELPDFENYFTREVYNRTIHSFMPPPNRWFHVVFIIELQYICYEDIQEKIKEVLFSLEYRDEIINHECELFAIIKENNVVFIPFKVFYNSDLKLFEKIYNKMGKHDNEMKSSYNYGILGAIASALISFYFFYDRNELYFIGSGRKWNE